MKRSEITVRPLTTSREWAFKVETTEGWLYPTIRTTTGLRRNEEVARREAERVAVIDHQTDEVVWLADGAGGEVGEDRGAEEEAS